MKIDAVAVVTTDMKPTVKFYPILGFDFSNANPDDGHVEPKTPDGSSRLMIDTKDMIEGILEIEPRAGNHSNIAIRYDSPDEIDSIATKLTEEGFSVIKEPWDAFWNQHYAIVEDPDGYRIDLYCDI